MPSKITKTSSRRHSSTGTGKKKPAGEMAAHPQSAQPSQPAKAGGDAETCDASPAADPQKVRERAVNAVLNATGDIVASIIQEASKGSYTAAKFLLDFAGISEPPPPAPQDDESLAAILLRELREGAENGSPTNSATSAAPSESVNLNH